MTLDPLLELMGLREEPPLESETDPREPDVAFRLRTQHEVENAILEMVEGARGSKMLAKVPPRAELVNGSYDREVLSARWHVVRRLGREVSDERVTELLEEGHRRIEEHEAERRARAEPANDEGPEG